MWGPLDDVRRRFGGAASHLSDAARKAEIGAARYWEEHFDDRPWREPPRIWTHGLRLTQVEVDGYAVVPEGGPYMTNPCFRRRHGSGTCDHCAVFAYVAATEDDARVAAQRELVAERAHGQLHEAKRLIQPVRGEFEGYDLSPILDSGHAEFVRDEIGHGHGDEDKEPAWKLAKQLDHEGRKCEGFVIPSSPPTLFCYAQCVGRTVFFADPVGPPVVLPSRSPQSALDFVRKSVLPFAVRPRDF